MDSVEHASHEGASPRQHLGCEGEFADEGLSMPTSDHAFPEEGAEKSCELCYSFGRARHCLFNRVQLYAEEGEALRRAFRLVRVDNQAELTDDGLGKGEVPLHV